jgi:hypothetical protein
MCSFIVIGERKPTAAVAYQRAGDRQSQASSTFLALAGEEWIENSIPITGWNSWAVIDDVQMNLIAIAARGDAKMCRARLPGVLD